VEPRWRDLNDINQLCGTAQATDYKGCFIDEMGDYASSQAVAFSQSLAEQKQLRVGYLTGLREAGGVDIGYVAYPSSPELSRGWVLVNGTPAIVDADDSACCLNQRWRKTRSFTFCAPGFLKSTCGMMKTIANRMPCRGNNQSLKAGKRFIIDYSLKDNCRTCAILGHASFGFDLILRKISGDEIIRCPRLGPYAEGSLIRLWPPR